MEIAPDEYILNRVVKKKMHGKKNEVSAVPNSCILLENLSF